MNGFRRHKTAANLQAYYQAKKYVEGGTFQHYSHYNYYCVGWVTAMLPIPIPFIIPGFANPRLNRQKM
jgi:hypothetical protein